MHLLACILGIVLVAIILLDGFEVIILPRRVVRRLRLSVTFYRSAWFVWSKAARRIRSNKRRERLLSFFGPQSLVMLIVVWGISLIFAFGLIGWSVAPSGTVFGQSLYLSGTTFITLGMGDVVPANRWARLIAVIEAGTGFGFIAMVIGYFPVLYQAFSQRETNILLLDARAGSPPSAAELFRRHASGGGLGELDTLLKDWEIWSADLLESYISFPVLAFFRSQHDNQSWLAALTTILDTCAVTLAGVDKVAPWQARLTFAMARHTVVDLAQIVNAPPKPPQPDRLPPEDLVRLKVSLAGAGIGPSNPGEFDAKLAKLRRMYEPYVFALSGSLMVSLSPWLPAANAIDNWRTSAWEHSSTGLPQSLFDDRGDVHN